MVRRATIAILILVLCVGGGLWAYHRYLRSVRVAVLRVDDVDWADWEVAGRRTGFTIHRYEHEDLASAPLGNYNFIVIRTMGLDLNEDQAANLDRARARGAQILLSGAGDERTEKRNTLSDEQRKTVSHYRTHGGVENLVGLLYYLAHEFAGKEVEVPPVIERPLSGFFHLGGRLFESLDEYETFLRKERPRLPADAPRVAMFGPLLRPFNELDRKPAEYVIQSLENQGVRVYPIFGYERSQSLLEAAKPDLAIAFPIGRSTRGSSAPEVLARLNCPCVSALTISGSLEDWLADPRGLSGPFMDLTITMPELDGVIEPIAITARVPNERNIRVRTLIPDRAQKRIALVLHWLKLRRKPNSQKRVVIVYYKGPGSSALAAGGLEVAPSLFNTLKRMEAEGYDLGGKLPNTPEALTEMIQTRGKTLGQWAIGSYEKFLEEAQPEFVPAADYAKWFKQVLSEKRQKEAIDLWGPIPGKQMVAEREGKPYLVVSRIQLGNVVIMPQPTVGGGGKAKDEVSAIHGTDQAAPHFYLGAYLWARYGFKADAIVHFGTHGSLEFTYGKSCCLSRDCWPDMLIGDVPHIYPYVINNVGEALVAKRRSNAVIVSHLTPPFCQSDLYGDLARLMDKIHAWEAAADPQLKLETCKTITGMVRPLDLATDIQIAKDALASRLMTDDEIKRLHEHLHELKDEGITDGLHVIGRPFTDDQIRNTAALMLSDDDRETVLASAGIRKSHETSQHDVVRELVDGVLRGKITPEQFFPQPELAQLRALQTSKGPSKGMMGAAASKRGKMGMQRRMASGSGPGAAAATPPADGKAKQPMGAMKPGASGTPEKPPRKGKPSQPAKPSGEAVQRTNAPPSGVASPTSAPTARYWGNDAASRPKIRGDQQQKLAFLAVLDQIARYGDGLRKSPPLELDRFLNALRGGYVPPSPGGDPLINPESVPTGNNLTSISAEHTPTEEAWRVGRRLADVLLAQHKTNTGNYPRRVAFTLWGGEFIRGKGTTIAEILYLIGVRPVWNSRGNVNDVEVIPSEELGRPRIDVLVQTSGQFRDAAASRITLMDKAVQIVSELEDEPFPNFVRDGSAGTEMQLKSLGYSPKEAREFATARIFGSAENRSYGTGIMGVVERGDTWKDEKQVADRYVQNMGGIYRDGAHWGTYKKGLLEAQMQGTEIVVQPRSSNTWGPLSLDHVYEFMGGMTLAVRAKTGTDPVGYFSDLRARGRPKLTTAISAIREEARTTVWNPKFLRGLQREGSSAAASLTETVRNMYGWTVMQPSTISQEMWDESYRVFIEDKHALAMRQYFEQKNPYALQDMASVMLETARKGYWKPSPEMLQKLAQLHAELVTKFGAGCSYETCGNKKLQEFVSGQLNAPGSQVAAGLLASYQAGLAAALESSKPLPEVKGIRLEETLNKLSEPEVPAGPRATVALAGCLVAFVLVMLLAGLRDRRAGPGFGTQSDADTRGCDRRARTKNTHEMPSSRSSET